MFAYWALPCAHGRGFGERNMEIFCIVAIKNLVVIMNYIKKTHL
jgi:hypothetical protein